MGGGKAGIQSHGAAELKPVPEPSEPKPSPASLPRAILPQSFYPLSHRRCASKSSRTARRHLCATTLRILPSLLSCPSTSSHPSHHHCYTTETIRSTFSNLHYWRRILPALKDQNSGFR